MLKTFTLISALYVTVFWAIILNGNKNTHTTPRAFLAKFMLMLIPMNLAKFLLYEPLPQLYFYIDIFYLYAGSLAFPLYHIYFRLLTVDEKFSWKTHYRFLVFPIILATIYTIAVFLAPHNEYKIWLFNRDAHLDIPQIRFLKTIRFIILISVELQAIYFLIINTILLKRYGNRAEQFYSNIEDGKYNNAKILNFLTIANCLLHVICAIDLMNFTTNKLIVYSVLFAIDYYMIGYMGNRLKSINPTFEVELDSPEEHAYGTELNISQKIIHNKILFEFENNKIYLNSELTILDLVQQVSSNRTNISTIINQVYNQNFCAFVNGYRINELERIIHDEAYPVNEILAEKAGFGSVKSMKRAISSKTGLAMSEWLKNITALEKELKNSPKL